MISAGPSWAPKAWGIMVENSAASPASTRMVRSLSSSSTVPDKTVNQSRPKWTPNASVPRGAGLARRILTRHQRAEGSAAGSRSGQIPSITASSLPFFRRNFWKSAAHSAYQPI